MVHALWARLSSASFLRWGPGLSSCQQRGPRPSAWGLRTPQGSRLSHLDPLAPRGPSQHLVGPRWQALALTLPGPGFRARCAPSSSGGGTSHESLRSLGGPSLSLRRAGAPSGCSCLHSPGRWPPDSSSPGPPVPPLPAVERLPPRLGTDSTHLDTSLTSRSDHLGEVPSDVSTPVP